MGNKHFVFLLVILTFLPYIHADWSYPVTVHESTNEYQGFFVSSIYVERLTKICHMFYVDQQEYSYYYASIDDNGKVFNKQAFMYGYWNWRGILRGTGIENHLFAAFNWYRVKDEAYISDINFTESLDGGKTWESFIRVPRADMDDATERFMGDIIAIEETGRVFIFYRDVNSIRMVSRPPGSSIFNTERIIVKDASLSKDAFLVTFNWKASTMLLHLFYVDNDDMKYISSSDNGATWKNPVILSKDVESSVRGVAANTKAGPNIFVAYDPKALDPSLMITSKNYGEDYSKPVPISNKTVSGNANSLGISLCSANGVPVLTTFELTNDNIGEYSAWNAETLKREIRYHPFTKIEIFHSRIFCSNAGGPKPGQNKIMLAIVTKSGTSRNKILLAHEDAYL